MKTRKIELTIERHQRLTIRQTPNYTQAWCAACGEQVVMASGEEAARLTGQRSRAIYRQVEQDSLHSSEQPDGTLFICLKSLFASIK
jgi:hypothetical protein